MNDSLMFDYLTQMGAMRPEQDEMKRKQAMVDALRGNSMASMQGEMVGKHYVAPGIGQAISQLGQAYMAKQGQGGVDAGMKTMNANQKQMLEEMRRKRMMGGGTNALMPQEPGADPFAQFSYGSEA